MTLVSLYPFIYGLAMFLVCNLIALPGGFLVGFQEARKKPLSKRARLVIECIDSVVEFSALVAITLRLIHQTQGNALFAVLTAFTVFVVLETGALWKMNVFTATRWLRMLATVFLAAIAAWALG